MNADGNLTNRGPDTFAYDQANRLKSATVAGVASTYVYDGDGNRVSKTVGGTTTNYINDTNRSLPVVLDDGTRKYVWGPDDLAYSVDITGNVQVYYSDGLGSVRAIADANGNVIETYQTDEFGVPVSTQGSVSQPFQYTGEQQDAEDGLYNLRARIYDPAEGRFLSRDVVAGSRSVPQTLNRYAYAVNNPARGVDPSGLWCVGPSIGGIGTEGVAAVGVAATAGGGAGACFGGSTGANVGVFVQGGAYSGMPVGPGRASYPQGDFTGTLGAFVGGGLGGFLSNATSIQQLRGPFHTISIDAGVGPVQGSIQISWSNGIWILNVSPPPAGVAIGAAITSLWTNTWIPWSTDAQGQATAGAAKNLVLR